MQRIELTPRPDWREQCERIGFLFHTIDGEIYWDESACYRFDMAQIEHLESVVENLHAMCMDAVEHVIRHRRYADLHIPPRAVPLIERSWREREPSLYGRFDLSWDGTGEPKMLEYNADTPTALYEASVVQWEWLRACRPGHDQFNSLHEKLVARWQALAASWSSRKLHLACMPSVEDEGTLAYLAETALQAGLEAYLLGMGDIGWNGRRFVDLHDQPIARLFKLYPWEWAFQDAFAAHLDKADTRFVEPAWKMILSNKGVLAILWELFPDHPNLLPSFFDNRFGKAPHVVKPMLSREGANIAIVTREGVVATGGAYAGPKIHQAFAPLPAFGENHAVIGAWVVGNEAAGMGIREDHGLITRDTSRFVPHYIDLGE